MNEYEYSVRTKYSAELPLINSNNDTPVWNISDTLVSLFSLYYKQILIQDIVRLLNKGIDPQNIVIFNSEFNPRKASYDAKILLHSESSLSPDTITLIYEFGLPYSMFPSKKFSELNILFRFFDSINKDLDSTLKLKTRKLRTAYRNYSASQDLIDGINYLVTATEELINNLKDKKVQEYLTERLSRKYNYYNHEYHDLIKNLHTFRNKNYSLLKGLISKTELVKEDLYIDYYNPFFSKLYVRWTPLVAYYNPELNSLEFLSNDVFKEYKNPYFFDVKSVVHNSPLSAGIIGSWASILSLAWTMYNETRGKYGSKFSDLIDLSELPAQSKKETKKIIREIEEYNGLTSFIKMSIPSLFIKDELLTVHEELLVICGKALKSMGFSLSTKSKVKIFVCKN
ncbi:hypothetical protein [Maribellus sediminis]|uniref:hypothetical protein n=1 Tax=Maribellus sediminis TaxID=2696285 RepID=UPI001431B68C|nr:hypothetical protein [Maribellus sediminis]